MRSYRLARRSFLAGIGGAFGLEILLRNMEAAAQTGPVSPKRFLLTHWPIGTYRQSFVPTGSPTITQLSPILMPFQPHLQDMIVAYGMRDNLQCPGGGGHEAGTPFTTTCASAPGTRANNGEADDGVAGGPSFDQIFLARVAGLKQPGRGFINTLADARVDSNETSTQCLSYDYATRSIAAAIPAGTMITEHTPLTPELSPAKAFAALFTGFMPGGGTPTNNTAAMNALRARKSVLDHCLRELATLKTLAPGSEAAQIDSHAAAVREIETQLSGQIAAGNSGTGTQCTVPAAPTANAGKTGSKFDYGREEVTSGVADEEGHAATGKAHAAVILAAFQCDLIRCATFQWSPGTNHVSFKGRYPAEPTKTYMHHPMSHRIGDSAFYNGPPLTGTSANASLYQFLVNIQTWYNQQMADILTTFKAAKDAAGNSILDYTVMPYVTEVGDPSHSRQGKAAIIFGGKALGLKGGQFFNRTGPYLDTYLTCAQALFQNADPLSQLPTTAGMVNGVNVPGEKFARSGAAPFPGAWVKPA